MRLDDLLTEARDEIVDDACDALARSTHGHYAAAGDGVRHERLAALYDLAARAVCERNLTEIAQHCCEVARQRYDAGTDLSEVQTAFNVLEEAIWERIVARMPREQLAEAFGLLSTVFGAGKDVLARTWVSLASNAHAPSMDLRALFRGTQGP